MTLEQALAFAVLAGAIALFIWDRFRYDLVAALALVAAVGVGIVPVEKAFEGFSDQIVVIVASALVVSAAVGRSGVVEWLIRPLSPYMRTTGMQIGVLAGAVAVMSAFMKNIAALALFIPIAVQIARRNGRSPSCVLMPLAFASLLGGLMTLIGTSPNIIVSRVRAEIVGEPFAMFDFTPVGLCLMVAGLAFLVFGYRLLPVGSRAKRSAEELFEVKEYVSEVRVPATATAVVGKTVADFEALSEGDVVVAAIIREKFRRYVPAADWTLFADDILVLEGDPHALQSVIARTGLELVGDKDEIDGDRPVEDIVSVEAVVTGASPMIGHTLPELRMRERHRVNVLAVSRRASRIATRLRRVRFLAGDVVVLRGAENDLPDAMSALGLLPLAERNVQLGIRRKAFVPVAVLAAAMALISLHVVPVTVGFFGAAVLLILLGSISLREAYDAIDWPILVLLGSLIPVSDALRTTGGTELIAGWLSAVGQGLPGYAAVGMIMVAAMAVTPFLNNAATVLVMGPVAASLATQLGLGVDAFLIAVAIGAACDFLTPIGHQCNTLVMGPGGYRFSDYWRLGLPLSVLVVLAGVPLILTFFPLQAG